MATTGQVPTWSEAVAGSNLPSSGDITYFFNTDRGGNLYSIDSAGNIVFIASKTDCCTCCLSELWLKGINNALATGGMTADQYNDAIAQGFSAVSTNDGAGNCSINTGVNFLAVTSVVVVEATSNVDVGGNVQLHGSVLPIGSDPRLLWTTSDATKATVSQTGVVTGHVLGTCTITAYSVADPTKFDTCAVTVITP